MRTGYLVTAVMLFASGAAFAQSIEGAADITASGGGANLNTRAAARLERRSERRDRREARLNALRNARARQQERLSGAAALDAAAQLMMPAPDDAPADEQPADGTTADSTNPEGEPADDSGQPFILMGFIAEGEGSGEIDGAEGDVFATEELEIEFEATEGEYDDEYADDSSMDDDPSGDDLPHGHGWPIIYLFGGAEGEFEYRGNSGEHSQGHHLGLFAPLDDLRGTVETQSSVETAAGVEVRSNSQASGQAGVAVSQRPANTDRAAQILARRLAQIDAMRDRALAEGNAALLEAADRLEASARLRFQTAGEEEITTGEPQPSGTTSAGSEPAGEAMP